MCERKLQDSSSTRRSEVAFHGGASFEAIGEDFRHLERSQEVISADVLDAWFDPSPRALQKICEFLPFLIRTSPPAYAAGLVRSIAETRGLSEDCILTGGGSSDLIFTLVPHLIGSSQKAVILDPMYGEYRHVLENVIGAEIVPFELHKEEEFRVNTDRLIAFIESTQPDLVVIVNPNSPTGQYWPRLEVIRFLDHVPSSVCVLVDETYVEYAGPRESVESEACKRSNVLVMKSMSKVYALSGIRVGYVIGAPSRICVLSKWLPPWAVNLPAQVAAIQALDDRPYYEERYEATHSLRGKLVQNLCRIPGIKVYPSMTNFVLVETQSSAQGIVERMRQSNVFIRNCDSMGSRLADRFVRIAVKREKQNFQIAAALSSAVERCCMSNFSGEELRDSALR